MWLLAYNEIWNMLDLRTWLSVSFGRVGFNCEFVQFMYVGAKIIWNARLNYVVGA